MIVRWQELYCKTDRSSIKEAENDHVPDKKDKYPPQFAGDTVL